MTYSEMPTGSESFIADTSAIIAAYDRSAELHEQADEPLNQAVVVVSPQKVMKDYRALRLDLADALNVVLADRYVTDSILTLDVRDFRVVRPLTSDYCAFRLPLQDLA